MFTSTPGLHPLDAHGFPSPSCDDQNVPARLQVSPGEDRLMSVENHSSQVISLGHVQKAGGGGGVCSASELGGPHLCSERRNALLEILGASLQWLEGEGRACNNLI